MQIILGCDGADSVAAEPHADLPRIASPNFMGQPFYAHWIVPT